MKCLPFSLLLAVAGPLHAQSVQVTMIALTPISVTNQTAIQTVVDSVPAGPLIVAPTDTATISALQSGPGYSSSAAAGWGSWLSPHSTGVSVTDHLESYGLPTSSMLSGPQEYLVAISATAPTDAYLHITNNVQSEGAATMHIGIDIDNDGIIEFVDDGSGLSATWRYVFDAQPRVVRVVMQTSLQDAGNAGQQVVLSVQPRNNLGTWTSAIGCSPFLIDHTEVFADRGIDIRAQSWNNLMVLVIGLSQQPVLLPSYLGTACLLLPATDIVMWNPLGEYHVALPAALRPVTFHAQGVELSPSGFLPTNALGVTAF